VPERVYEVHSPTLSAVKPERPFSVSLESGIMIAALILWPFVPSFSFFKKELEADRKASRC